MSVTKAMFLGIVQGVTEFLPVSSSGHLAIFGQNDESFGLYSVVLFHLGTLMAIIVYYRRDLREALFGGARLVAAFRRAAAKRGSLKDHLAGDAGSRLALMVIVASIPTAVVGLGLKSLAEYATGHIGIVGVCFIITGVLMYFADRFVAGKRPADSAGVVGALFVGLFQGLAVMPGLSRSGLTIFAGLSRGVERREAARLSFLISVPAFIGAMLVELGTEAPPGDWTPAVVGAVAAFVSGYVSLTLLVSMLASRRLRYFTGYLFVLGAAVLIWM